jgi:hypothetical protein
MSKNLGAVCTTQMNADESGCCVQYMKEILIAVITKCWIVWLLCAPHAGECGCCVHHMKESVVAVRTTCMKV